MWLWQEERLESRSSWVRALQSRDTPTPLACGQAGSVLETHRRKAGSLQAEIESWFGRLSSMKDKGVERTGGHASYEMVGSLSGVGRAWFEVKLGEIRRDITF